MIPANKTIINYKMENIMRYTVIAKEPVLNNIRCHEDFSCLDECVEFIEEISVRESDCPYLLPIQTFRTKMYNMRRKKFRVFDNLLQMEVALLKQ